MSRRLNVALVAMGALLACGGMLFVGLRLRGQWAEMGEIRLGVRGWAIVALLTLVYGAAGVMLARAWWSLLDFFGSPTRFSWCVRAYGLSQLAKYVPGNVAHLAGRHVMGLAAGVPGWALAKASFWEFGSLGIVAVLFSILVLPSAMGTKSSTPWAVVLFPIVFSLTFSTARRFIDARVATCFAWHAAFLTIMASLFVAVLMVLGTAITLAEAPLIGGAYVVGWLAGLATPGAPAGAGVRELVVMLLLNDLGGRNITLAVVLLRFVTIGGDMAFFAASSVAGRTTPTVKLRDLDP